MTDQMTMTGADWLSDRDRKAQARLEAAREKTGRILARRLDAAVEALRDYMNACNEIGDESRVKHQADGRLRLQEDCAEYANWLHSVHGE
jgi:vacuolar-type H+-ATPase subunit H